MKRVLSHLGIAALLAAFTLSTTSAYAASSADQHDLTTGRTATATTAAAATAPDAVGPVVIAKTGKDVGTQSVCGIRVGGKYGEYICEYGYTDVFFDGRWHFFVVGTDYAVWHIWQVSPGGSYSNWTTLAGQARSGVYSTTGSNWLRIRVLGTDTNSWCRTYSLTTGWTGWYRC